MFELRGGFLQIWISDFYNPWVPIHPLPIHTGEGPPIKGGTPWGVGNYGGMPIYASLPYWT